MSTYDEDDIQSRIDYAQYVIETGRDTNRDFDGCFEMGDGDEVVKALISLSKTSPKLKANLSRYIAESSIRKFS